jgi:hypothetical protein
MPPLPPMLGWTAAAIAATALARLLVKEWRRVNDVLHAEKSLARDQFQREAIPKLRRDPRTGIYHPE